MEKHSHSPQFVYFAAALNGVAMVVLFSLLALSRNVDGDEGLYLEAARLVGQGKHLYTDFFYQQMPLIPYFYAAWAKVFGPSLVAGRILSALLTAGSGFFVLFYIARSTKNLFLVNAAAILLYTNGIFLAWAPVIKTHPFNVFFLTGSCVLLLEWRRSLGEKAGLLLLSGLLLGLGINCRLTLAPFPLFYLIFIAVAAPGKIWRPWGAFLLGLLIASLPALYYLSQAPTLFIKYNLFFHTRIFPGMAGDDFRWSIAYQVLLDPQLLALLVAFYVGLILRSLKGWSSLAVSDSFFIFVLLAAYYAIHLSTATPFTQYFSTVVPLLVVGTIPLLELTLVWNAGTRALVLVPIFALYAIAASSTLRNEMYSVGTLEPVWKISNVQTAVAAIRRVVKPGETCLTWWPGYAALSGCASVPGMENHMRDHAILRGIPQRLLNEYKMLSSEQVIDLLASKKYRVVIDGAYRLNTPYNEYAEYILKENYSLRTSRGMARIYVRKGSGESLGDRFFKAMDSSIKSPEDD